ncbi:putative leader peptide [Streptomyces sp. NPDC090106]
MLGRPPARRKRGGIVPLMPQGFYGRRYVDLLRVSSSMC